MAFPPWRKRPAPAEPPAPPPPPFDALITLGPYNMPPGIPPARAIVAVRQAVNALPGAAWISVEHHPAGPAADAVQVFPASPDHPQLLQTVEAAVSQALRSLGPPPTITPTVSPAIPGFAEQPLSFPPPTPAALQSTPWLPEPDAAMEADAPNRLQQAGDAELLALLLDLVTPEGATRAATRAVQEFGSFAAVLAQPPADLLKLPGLGTHSVAAIKLMHAAALRLSRASIMDQPVVTSFDALMQYLTAVLAREPLEHFRILFLDAEGRVRADEAQARGTVNHTPVYPREVVRRALELGAASIILVHNHPSGDPTPSAADLQMTDMVRDACRVVGLEVQDHIIVGNGRWFSFRQTGFLMDP